VMFEQMQVHARHSATLVQMQAQGWILRRLLPGKIGWVHMPFACEPRERP